MSGWSDGYKLRHDKNITLLYIALMASPVCEALLGIRWYQILSGSGIVPFLLLFLFASTTTDWGHATQFGVQLTVEAVIQQHQLPPVPST